jgi:hypothetical protein
MFKNSVDVVDKKIKNKKISGAFNSRNEDDYARTPIDEKSIHNAIEVGKRCICIHKIPYFMIMC